MADLKKQTDVKQIDALRASGHSASSGNEKIFNINIKVAYKKSHENRVPYAMKMVRSYLKQHMKTDTVKIGPKLNEAIWARGIKRPPSLVRVKAVLDEGVVKAELVGHEYKEFKAAPKKEKKGAREKLMERLGPKAIHKEEEEKKVEGKKEETPAENKEAKMEAKAEAREAKSEKQEKK